MIRRATHAGSWYENDPKKLKSQFDNWINNTKVEINPNVRALIGPHAGYSYCGKTAAYAYKTIDPNHSHKRVFVLGPSHHIYFEGFGVSDLDEIETPFGNLKVCKETIESLGKEISLKKIEIDENEDEHSLEMHFPWIHYSFGKDVKIIPIMVGKITSNFAQSVGEIFSKYLEDKDNFMVISSDFCHWGSRFDYTYYEKQHGPIHKSIEFVDKLGMKKIESLDSESFWNYIKSYKNTICGRHPIYILMNAIEKSSKEFDLNFLHYSQSSQCKKMNDSSVSYASGVLSFK